MKCSKRRTLLFSIAALVVVVAAVVCVLVLTHLQAKKDQSSSKEYRSRTSRCDGKDCSLSMRELSEEAASEKICPTEDCVVAAARMLKWMDRGSDPCRDFYNFSCGSFLRSHSLPEGWDSYGRDDVIAEEIDLNIKSIVEEPIHVNDSDSLRDTKLVYDTCLDLTHIEGSSVSDLRRALSGGSGVGEWPFLNPQWRDCRPDVEWRMAKLNSMGLDALVTLDTEFQGEDNRLLAVMRFSPPLVSGICDQEEEDEDEYLTKLSEHREILQNVLELLDVSVNDNDTAEDISDLFHFDFRFCRATKKCIEKAVKLPERSEDRFTLLKLADVASQINWIRWRNIVLSELRLNFPHDRLPIYADGMEECVDDINDLLLNSTSKVLANYLTWRFVFHHLGFLGKQFRQVLENHHRLTRTFPMFSDRRIPRWRQCVIYLKEVMPMAMLKEYKDIYHHDDIDKEMENIVDRMKDEFKIILKDNRDLLETDSSKSYQKVDEIKVEIAYPDKKDKFYDTFYSGLGRMSTSFLNNGIKLMSTRMRKLLEGVSRKRTIQDMEFVIQRLFSPFDLRAYSSFRGNNIILTLGHLQADSVEPTFPKFKTMSTFGWAIGHELAHGFDLTALDGSLNRNWTWWPSYVLQQARKKANCFLEFFPYPKTGHHEDTKNLLLNEDLCDSQGMYLAFEAYLTYLNKHGDEEVLPGLPLSTEKLFFISYAQQFCEIRRNEDHPTVSPGRRRVNQVLKNFPAFSAVFRCPGDSPMNYPKCSVLWT